MICSSRMCEDRGFLRSTDVTGDWVQPRQLHCVPGIETCYGTCYQAWFMDLSHQGLSFLALSLLHTNCWPLRGLSLRQGVSWYCVWTSISCSWSCLCLVYTSDWVETQPLPTTQHQASQGRQLHAVPPLSPGQLSTNWFQVLFPKNYKLFKTIVCIYSIKNICITQRRLVLFCWCRLRVMRRKKFISGKRPQW